MRRAQNLVNICLVFAIAGVLWSKYTDSFRGSADFLRAQELPFRGWKETDYNLTKDEETMLKPDAVLVRSYEGPGEFLEFAVIAGHRKQTVHTPAYCMVGGGWEKVSVQNTELITSSGKIPVTRSIMIKDRQELLVTYFFSDGTASTRDLVAFQGRQFMRRVLGQSPLGALVRIAVPVTKGRAAADQLVQDYAQQHLPKVLEQITKARETAQ